MVSPHFLLMLILLHGGAVTLDPPPRSPGAADAAASTSTADARPADTTPPAPQAAPSAADGEPSALVHADRPTIAVSIPPIAWIAEQLAGDDALVVTLLPRGASPATFEPSDHAVTNVMRADLFVCVGVPFELGPWFSAIRSSGVPIIDVRSGLELRAIEAHGDGHTHAPAPRPETEPSSDGHDHEHDHDHDHGHDHGHGHVTADHAAPGISEPPDPHVWTSPRRLRAIAATLAARLAELVPHRADAIARRAHTLDTRLDDLDRDLARELAPASGRSFCVFHPAWGYLADDYGLTQVAVEVGGRTPVDHELTELMHMLLDHQVTAVFVQPQIAGTSAAAVARSAGVPVITLDPLAPDPTVSLRRAAALIATGGAP